MLKIGVLYGGRSGEHDVSLSSAANIISKLDVEKYDITAIGIDRDGRWYVQDKIEIVDDADFGHILKLNKNGNWHINHFERDNKLHLHDSATRTSIVLDLVIPALHGSYCEDGTLQGLLELIRVPYVGADHAGSAIGMDKSVTKKLLRDAQIPVVPWIDVYRFQWKESRDEICRQINETFDYPLFVKPANAGSSVGVKKVTKKEDLIEAMDFSLQFDLKVLVETAITGREVECAVLGNFQPEASVLGEIIPKHDFYSYEAKYIDEDGADMKIPAEIPDSIASEIRKSAVEAFVILNCSGLARIDFFYDSSTDEYFLNEINTLPGFTNISMYPKLWEYSGLSQEDLMDKLIELALELHREKISIKREI